MKGELVISVEQIGQWIRRIRGQRVMLDADLAELYGVSTRQLNQQVRRNLARFPADFMFTLTPDEFRGLTARSAASQSERGGRRKLPRVFTQEGVAMLSSVLRSKRALEANIFIMRAFVKQREMLSAHKDLARRLDELEKKYDSQFKDVFAAIREMAAPAEEPRRPIGFQVETGG